MWFAQEGQGFRNTLHILGVESIGAQKAEVCCAWHRTGWGGDTVLGAHGSRWLGVVLPHNKGGETGSGGEDRTVLMMSPSARPSRLSRDGEAAGWAL